MFTSITTHTSTIPVTGTWTSTGLECGPALDWNVDQHWTGTWTSTGLECGQLTCSSSGSVHTEMRCRRTAAS